MKKVVYFVGKNVFNNVSLQFITECKDDRLILNFIKNKVNWTEVIPIIVDNSVCRVYDLYVNDKVYRLIIEIVDEIKL